jgi:hypothetical protein
MPLQDFRIELPLAVGPDSTGRRSGAPTRVSTLVENNAGAYLFSRLTVTFCPVVPIYFFRALLLEQLVSRHVFLDLIIGLYGLRRLDSR